MLPEKTSTKNSQTTKDAYCNVSHIASSVFVDINERGEHGRLLLFVFTSSKTKELAEVEESREDTLQIILRDSLSESSIVGMHDFLYPTWAYTFERLSSSPGVYVELRMLPEGFWQMEKNFRSRFLDKTFSSALSSITKFPDIATDAFELETIATHAGSIVNGVINMEKMTNFDKIRTYGFRVASDSKKGKGKN